MKIHILHHAAAAPVYGTTPTEELARHGYELSSGILYPLLHGLETDGLLWHEERVVAGRAPKYCTATDEGRRALEQARRQIAELVDEVLDGRGATSLAATEPSGDGGEGQTNGVTQDDQSAGPALAAALGADDMSDLISPRQLTETL